MSEPVHQPRGVLLPQDVHRTSVRPPAYRNDTFDAEFDDSTLFYDAIWVGDRALLIGPPLHNLALSVAGMRVLAVPSHAECHYEFEHLDLHMRLWVTPPAGTTALRLQTSMGSFEVTVSPSQTSLFAGRRVLYTMSKDNTIAWMQDWIRFHRDVHGADAVLVYDNNSSRYNALQLQDSLQELSGVRSQVVSWNFPFGPQGFLRLGYWDSNYGQLGGLDHARWTYLGMAQGVVIADIDELLLVRGGGSVFERLARSRTGSLRYHGKWVTATGQDVTQPQDQGRHRDFTDVVRPRDQGLDRLRRRGWCPTKWAVDPRRCPPTAQWHIHRIKRWPLAIPVAKQVEYRHFRPLSTNWKYGRGGVEAFDSALHERDEALVRAYASVDWFH